MTNTQNRNTAIDFSKAVAIYLVVLAHLLRDGHYFAYMAPASVPVFFFLSGVTYHFKPSASDFFKKKIRSIIIPYFFTGLISILVFLCLGELVGDRLGASIKTTDLLPNLLNLLYGNSKAGAMKWNNSLWFLPCLFVILTLVYLFDKLCDHFHWNVGIPHRLFFALLCGILGVCLSVFYPKLHLVWHFESALCNVPFFELGICSQPLISKCSKQKENKKMLVLHFVFFLLAALILGSFNGASSPRTDEYGQGYLLYFAAALCFAAAFLSLGTLLDSHAPVCTYVGCNTMPILLWNKFPIILMQTTIAPLEQLLKTPDEPSALLAALLPGIVVIALCIAVGKIQKKILPFSIS